MTTSTTSETPIITSPAATSRHLGTGAYINGGTVTPRILGDDSTIIQWNPIPRDSEGSDFRSHSLFFNDTWRRRHPPDR